MAAQIKIEIDEKTLRQLVLDHLKDSVNFQLKEEDVHIEVKSKQNYKSEWETAAFRARIERTV